MPEAKGLLEHSQHCNPRISSKAASGNNERMESGLESLKSLRSALFRRSACPLNWWPHPLLPTHLCPVRLHVASGAGFKWEQRCRGARHTRWRKEAWGGLLSCARPRRSQIFFCFRGTPAGKLGGQGLILSNWDLTVEVFGFPHQKWRRDTVCPRF